MKKILLTITLALAMIPLFAIEVPFDSYNLIGKDITELHYLNMTQINTEKEYSRDGDLVSVKKETMIFAIDYEFDEILTDTEYSFALLTTGNASNIIETVTLYILGVPEQNRNSFAYIAKQLFGELDSDSIITFGSKEWYDNLSYMYEGIYDGYNVQLSYYESSNYHLNKDSDELLISLTFEK